MPIGCAGSNPADRIISFEKNLDTSEVFLLSIYKLRIAAAEIQKTIEHVGGALESGRLKKKKRVFTLFLFSTNLLCHLEVCQV